MTSKYTYPIYQNNLLVCLGIIWTMWPEHSFTTLEFSTFNILGIDILPWHSDTTVGKCAQLLTVKDLTGYKWCTLYVIQRCSVPTSRHHLCMKYTNLISRSIASENLLNEKHSAYSLRFEFYTPGWPAEMVRILKIKVSGHLYIPLQQHFSHLLIKFQAWLITENHNWEIINNLFQSTFILD